MFCYDILIVTIRFVTNSSLGDLFLMLSFGWVFLEIKDKFRKLSLSGLKEPTEKK